MKAFIAKAGSLVLLSAALVFNAAAPKKQVKYVNPLIGTDAHGHTFPGATVPFGMVQLSPDNDVTGWDWCSGYHYSDNTIMGFSHTHLNGTGCTDYGDILFMPTTGELKTEPGPKDKPGSGYRSRFSHANEIAKAGYYSVMLDDYKIKAELTATRRTGFHKYTFPKSDNAHILIDLAHGIQDQTTDAKIEVLDNKSVQGYRRSIGWGGDHYVYFAAEFSKPFKSYGLVDNGKVLNLQKSAAGRKLKAFFNYITAENEPVLVKVGISFVSAEGAWKNLKGELKSFDFEKVKNKAEADWQKELSKISVDEPSEALNQVFYTAYYHALIAPNTFSDFDGSYLGMDKKIHKAKGNDIYTVFSLWDTFRAEHPLFTLTNPKQVQDMVNTLLAKYDESGLLPVWEMAAYETNQMIGYHSVSVIADAYLKGIRGFDAEKAFEAMKKSAMNNDFGLRYYKDMGYVNCDLENEGASKTLEYAYDDWCIAKMAEALGRKDDYNYFIKRAKNYINIFDPSTSLMRPKKNSKWVNPFDPYAVSGYYTEANAWQYSFFAPQDINGLIKLLKGNENFIAKLDEMFNADTKLTGHFQSDITGMIGQYAHGNEPSHHMAYLYNYAGAPSKTQMLIHRVLDTLYTAKPDGLCGNDDCGQMSAWYIFSAMGFYPVCPGDNTYVIGTPHFKKTTINPPSGKAFTVIANNLSNKNYYIQSAKLNGRDYPYSYIKHSDVVKGGTLVFEMGPEPGKWGSEEAYRPKTSIDIPFVPAPVLTEGDRVFTSSTTAALASADNTGEVYYTTDGSNPVDKKNKYTEPFTINNSTAVKAVTFKNGNYSSVMEARFNKLPEGWSVKLKNQYHENYTGGGAIGLVDGIKGTMNFRTGLWQGYEGVDLDAVIDMGKPAMIDLISASFLQNTGSWIFYPTFVEYYVSNDGLDFEKVYEEKNTPDENKTESGIKEFQAKINRIEARYIKVIAKNVGICPVWHKGAGDKAWLFADEITIRQSK